MARRGFTLVELLVSLAVGMLVVQVAFISFFFIHKYIRRIERVDASNQTAQAAVLWAISRPTIAGTPPYGPVAHNIGLLTPPPAPAFAAARRIYTFSIHDFNNPPYVHWIDIKLPVPIQP